MVLASECWATSPRSDQPIAATTRISQRRPRTRERSAEPRPRCATPTSSSIRSAPDILATRPTTSLPHFLVIACTHEREALTDRPGKAGRDERAALGRQFESRESRPGHRAHAGAFAGPAHRRRAPRRRRLQDTLPRIMPHRLRSPQGSQTALSGVSEETIYWEERNALLTTHFRGHPGNDDAYREAPQERERAHITFLRSIRAELGAAEEVGAAGPARRSPSRAGAHASCPCPARLTPSKVCAW